MCADYGGDRNDLDEALRLARYNEAVIVSIAENSDVEYNNARSSEISTRSSSNGYVAKELVLVACLDDHHGGIQWKDASLASTGTVDVGISRHLRTKRWVLPMLNDARRNQLYDRAIDEACQLIFQKYNNKIIHGTNKNKNDSNMKDNRCNDNINLELRSVSVEQRHRENVEKSYSDCTVSSSSPSSTTTIRILDIGSGTGLLAMMAAKHAGRLLREQELTGIANDDSSSRTRVLITSVEMASAMARLARMTISENKANFTDNVSIAVVECHSTDQEFFIQDDRFQKNGMIHGDIAFGEEIPASAVSSVKETSSKIDNNDKPCKNQQSTLSIEKEKADICISELLESGFLGEGILPSMRDAWERHLKPDSIVVPRRGRIKAVLVEGHCSAFSCHENKMIILRKIQEGKMHDGRLNGDTLQHRAINLLSCDKEKKSNTSFKDYVKTKQRVNPATAFYGPDQELFHIVSGGVWLSTTAASTSFSNASESHSYDLVRERSNFESLGDTQCRYPHSDHDSHFELGGITVPLHANSMLNNIDIDPSSYRQTHISQEYDNYSTIFPCTTDEFNEKHPSISMNPLSPSHNGSLRPLTDPMTVLSFDFTSGSALPPSSGRSSSTQFTPKSDGFVDGILYWWELELGDGDIDVYSTEPIGFISQQEQCVGQCSNVKENSSSWQDHWQQCLFLFGEESSSRVISSGFPVNVLTSHDDCSISFSIEEKSNPDRSNDDKSDQNFSRPTSRPRRNNDLTEALNETPRHWVINQHVTPFRALQLSDLSRIETLRDAILFALQVKGRDAPLLDLSDMGLCAIIAAVAGKATRVTSLESSSGKIPALAAKVAQIGNDLPKETGQFQIVQALPENLTIEYIVGEVAEIVVAEPYYETLEGWHLQEALNYFYLVRSLKLRGVISSDAFSVPSTAHVMACAVQFDEFYSAYGKMRNDEKQMGFQHSTVDHYGDCADYDISLPLWQYKWKRLSTVFCVSSFDYEGKTPSIKDLDWVTAEFERVGTCHAIVFWVDYLCRSSKGTHIHESNRNKANVISTMGSFHCQAVRKLPSPVFITEADLGGALNFSCKVTFGNDPRGIEDHNYFFKFFRQ